MMSILNFSMSYAAPTLVAHAASQNLLNILVQHRFVEIHGMGVVSHRKNADYVPGQNYYFRKHGLCTVNFLKDGRLHVLHGPIALWNLHDSLTHDELSVLIAFASLTEEYQELMRNYMAPRCKKYQDVLNQMPSFHVDWKQEFLLALTRVNC